MDPNGESVASGGRDAIARHTEVVPHVESAYLLQPQLGALHDIHLLASQEDVVPVLPPPDNVGWRIPIGVTGQGDVVTLPHHHVVGLARVDDGGRHYHLDIS